MRRGVAAAVAVLTLAGCTSSGHHASPSSASPNTSVEPGGAAASASAALLARRMRAGLAGIRSAHVSVDAGLLGTSNGVIAYRGGTARASQFEVSAGGSNSTLVTIGSTTYAKLPAGQSTGKPWVVVRSDSTNEFVRALSAQLIIVRAAASLPALADVAATATGVRRTGSQYSMALVPARAASTPLGPLLESLGQKQIPTTVTVDSSGRPTKIALTASLGGAQFEVDVVVNAYNAPVHVSAPPASQIAS